MRRLVASIAVIALVSASTVVLAQKFKNIREFLTGYEETPAVSSVAEGEFNARISDDATQIDYVLSYSDLEGAVTQAHIHFGQKGIAGGISVWLCGNPNPPSVNPPAGTQLCPAPPATITGTLTAANVVGPTAQGIAAGEFAELIKAMRAGKTYVNVHSSKFPSGEIRSQIGPSGIADHTGHADH